jgi:hypothetical protein
MSGSEIGRKHVLRKLVSSLVKSESSTGEKRCAGFWARTIEKSEHLYPLTTI